MGFMLNKKITYFSFIALILIACSIEANTADNSKVSPKFYDGNILCSRMLTQYINQVKRDVEGIIKIFYSWVKGFDKSFSSPDSPFFFISTPSKPMGHWNPKELQETNKDTNNRDDNRQNGDSLSIYFWLLIIANGFLLLCSSLLRLFSDHYDFKLNN